MTVISLNRNFSTYYADLEQLSPPDVTLDLQGQLDNLTISEAFLIGDPTLNASGLTARFASRDSADTQSYTLRIEGSGIGPVSSLDGLQDALEQGTATGTLSRISVDYGTQRAVQIDLAPGQMTITSGAQSLELSGGLPLTLTGIFDLLQILDGSGPGTLSDYGFTGLVLRDGDQTLAAITLGETSEISISGYSFTMTGAEIDLGAIYEFYNPNFFRIAPELQIFDANGQLVEDGVRELAGYMGHGHGAEWLLEVPDGGGVYYLGISAQDPATIEIPDYGTTPMPRSMFEPYAAVGYYSIWGPWWEDDSDPDENGEWEEWGLNERRGDAPADVTTQYDLGNGHSFTGRISTTGDVDWIRITLPDPRQVDLRAWEYQPGEDGQTGTHVEVENAVSFSVYGMTELWSWGALRDIPGIFFDTITITAPDGVQILSATDVESFATFIDTLDSALESLLLPRIGGLGLAFATGDPHLLTHDGLGYDFHAAGEYVLMRATNGDAFELQSRMEPAGENVTANTAAGLRMGEDVIMIAPGTTPLLVNGVATALADGSFLPLAGGSIVRDGNSYSIRITDPVGTQSLVQVDIVGARIDIGVGLSDYWQNNVEGLLGNFSGSIRDDLRLPTGEALSFPLEFGDEDGRFGLYGAFREGWRVGEDTTLFSYGPGEGPDSFYLPDYPTQMITLADFSVDDRAEAEALAEAAGLVPGSFAFNNAVLDLLITEDESYLDSAVATQETLNDKGATQESVHVPDVAGGGIAADGRVALEGRIMDLAGEGLSDTTVTFQPQGRSVALTRLTREGDSFSFDLSEGASGSLQASRGWQAGDPAITANDALDVLRMAVGLNPSFGPAKAQNFIAADINRDGQITAQDALEVLRTAVGLASDHAPRWVFFDAATEWDMLGLSRSDTTVGTGREVSPLEVSQSGMDMVGILLGNMDIVA